MAMFFFCFFSFRKTFDVMIRKEKEKVQRSHFRTILPHFCTNFYGSKHGLDYWIRIATGMA